MSFVVRRVSINVISQQYNFDIRAIFTYYTIFVSQAYFWGNKSTMEQETYASLSAIY